MWLLQDEERIIARTVWAAERKRKDGGWWMVLTIMVLYEIRVCVFGLPPGSAAKLKPRKSDYGVPRGGMPSSQLMSAHLLLAVFCTASPAVGLEANLLTIIAR